MKLDEAQKMVSEALEQRRKFGKHFTVNDMPPEFLDALVIVHDSQPKVTAEDLEKSHKLIMEQKDMIVLLNRQLGAAKSRETMLRKQLAEVTKQTEV